MNEQLCDTPLSAYSDEQLLERVNLLIKEINRRDYAVAMCPGQMVFVSQKFLLGEAE